jgi:predicted transcriptional regulator
VDLEDTVAAQRDYIKHLYTEIERLQGVIYDMDRRIVTLIGEHQALSIKYAAEVTRRG